MEPLLPPAPPHQELEDEGRLLSETQNEVLTLCCLSRMPVGIPKTTFCNLLCELRATLTQNLRSLGYKMASSHFCDTQKNAQFSHYYKEPM